MWPAGLPPHKCCVIYSDLTPCARPTTVIGVQPERTYWDVQQTQAVQNYESKCTDFHYDDDYSNTMVGVAAQIRPRKQSFHHLKCSILHCHAVPKAFHGNTRICHIGDADAWGFVMCTKCAGCFSDGQRKHWDDPRKHLDDQRKQRKKRVSQLASQLATQPASQPATSSKLSRRKGKKRQREIACGLQRIMRRHGLTG
jgi:hypothetical protein